MSQDRQQSKNYDYLLIIIINNSFDQSNQSKIANENTLTNITATI